MRFVDVNVLVYAHRPEAPRHEDFHAWLREAMVADEPLAVADIVLTGFVRVVTHPKVFREPTPTDIALDFAEAVRTAPSAVGVFPSNNTWPRTARLIDGTGVRGNDVHDAYLAALASESGATIMSADRGFARFPDIKWSHPLDD